MSERPISLRAVIEAARADGRCAFLPYITMGHPSLESSLAVLERLEAIGCDAVEVGIPFSDPVADGPTIQRSSDLALAQGVHLRSVLDALAGRPSVRPRLLFSYLNPLLSMGLELLPAKMREAGLGAALITDLIPEEAADWLQLASREGIECCFLASVTSDEHRLRQVAAASSAFVYCISTLGVTGARRGVDGAARETVQRLRAFCELPIGVGFGISTPADVRELSEYADAAIVGSALLRAIGDEADGAADRAEEFVVPMLEACRR